MSVAEEKPEALDTIFSPATGIGKAAVAIVRVSGPACRLILATLCPEKHFVERRATLARITNHAGELVDCAMIIFFGAPQSFTGEDLIEFQITGSRAVLIMLLKALASFPGTRAADAGEFTRRSFENGKRDLAEVEGLAAVVEAETAAQLRNAQRAASGELSRLCESIRLGLLSALARMETLLDFSDVEDPNAGSLQEVFQLIGDTRSRIEAILKDSGAVERLRDGLIIVIAGPPNAGKSTLINLLTNRDVSIVSSIPGTTRDLIEVPIEILGFPIVFVDTAGCRDPADPIEAEGIMRARRKQEGADLVLWLSSCVEAEDVKEPVGAQRFLHIKTKGDLAPHVKWPEGQIVISAKTGEGVDRLTAAIADFAHTQLASAANSLITSQRQRAAILEAKNALARSLDDPHGLLEMKTEELRVAARSMSRVIGRIDVEDILGDIFSRLCVGK